MTHRPRLDRVLILARGRSVRMGRPKGLCTIPGQEKTMLCAVVDLYDTFELPVDIITLPSLVDPYKAVLDSNKSVTWLTAEGGGDTALSVFKAVELNINPLTHYWVHPVDLPLVTLQTLQQLQRHRNEHPQRIIRPRFTHTPGHPVILPLTEIQALLELSERSSPDHCHEGPLRNLLDFAQTQDRPVVVDYVDVDDMGVCRDYDDPASLAQDDLK